MFNKNYWEDVLEANEDLRRINSRLEKEIKCLSLVDDEQRIYIKKLEQQITKLTLSLEEEKNKKILESNNINCVIHDLKNNESINYLLDKQVLIESIKNKLSELLCVLHEFEEIKEETE